jgi:hypothetical protein
MALTDIPFLSISAKGSIGPLTSRSSHRSFNILQRPSPPVPLSVARVAQFEICRRVARDYRNPASRFRDTFAQTLAANAEIWHFPSVYHMLVSCYYGTGLKPSDTPRTHPYGMSVTTVATRISWYCYDIFTNGGRVPPVGTLAYLKRPEDSFYISLPLFVRGPTYVTYTVPTSHRGRSCKTFLAYHQKPRSALLIKATL